MMLFRVFFNATNKNPFHSLVGTRSLRNLETVLFGSTHLPWTLSGPAFMVSSISSTAAYVTNPKPLEHLVLGSLITTQSVRVSPLLKTAPQTLIDESSNLQ